MLDQPVVRARVRGRVAGLLAWLLPVVVAAYPAPPPDPSAPPSSVPSAVQQLRRDMLDAGVSTLTFQSMDRIFTTRPVPRAGAVWELPRADRPLDFEYTFRGTRRPASAVLERTHTNALLVIKDGHIVAEIYRNNMTPQTRHIVFSVTKSITSVLIGRALEEGRISSLDDPVTRYLPELAAGGYAGVTIRQVLQMRSGVDYEERYDFGNPGTAARNHEQSLVRNAVRFADVARGIARRHPPGEVFAYKTLDTAVLGWLLERVSGGGTVAAYTAQRLWEPLGAEADAYYILDGEPGTGREFSGAGFNATLRDLGRFGQMVLDGGVANGRRIVSEAWIRASTRPSGPPGGAGPAYGYQWWMVAKPGSFQAIGLQGQYIHVDPATRTVVVKLSHYPPDDSTSDEEVAAFLDAVSAWNPALPAGARP